MRDGTSSGAHTDGFWKRHLDKIGLGGTLFVALRCLGFPAPVQISEEFGNKFFPNRSEAKTRCRRQDGPRLAGNWPFSNPRILAGRRKSSSRLFKRSSQEPNTVEAHKRDLPRKRKRVEDWLTHTPPSLMNQGQKAIRSPSSPKRTLNASNSSSAFIQANSPSRFLLTRKRLRCNLQIRRKCNKFVTF